MFAPLVESAEASKLTRLVRLSLPLAASLFAVVIAISAGVLDRSRPLTFGHDLLPSYTAGRLVFEGRGGEIYDVAATQSTGRQIIASENLTNDATHVCWINPGFFSLLFAPLASLPYRTALLVWIGLNAGLLTIALRAMTALLPSARAKAWLLLATLTSCPFLLAVEHQQNTFLSLLLLSTGVIAWRAERPLTAGLVLGLLAYKPQLAAALGLVLVVSEGRRAFAGLLISGTLLLVAGEAIAPGSTVSFLTGVPQTVSRFHQHPTFNWGRQITPLAFWRSLFGVGSTVAMVLGYGCSIVTLGATLWMARAARRISQPTVRRNGIVILAICSLPLTAPYFMDYDLLLLIVPAALCLSSHRVSLGSGAFGVLLWLALYLNVDLVRVAHVNGAVVLLAVAALLAGWRLLRKIHRTPSMDSPQPAATPSFPCSISALAAGSAV